MQDEWIADDIAYTLSHKCYVHGHRVEPRDICVLVSRRSYAERLIDELRRRGIRTCLPSNQDVFATGEAEDILAILKAMDAPTDLRLLAQARTTRILGDTLKNFSGDQQAVIRARTDIQETAEKFRRMGLTAAFEQLFERRAVVSRMLQLKAGRQHLRNYRHVIELLQRRAMSLPVLAGLIRWFESEKQGGKVPEERHVRIESDEDLVTFSTIHGSKGLEYPIVYLAHASRQEDVKQWEKKAAFVKFKDAGKPVIGMILDANGIPEDVRAQEIAEQEQEIARKVYVAMTRASSRLVLPLVQKRNKGLYTKVPGFGTVPKPAAWTGENPYWKVASGWNEPDPAVVPAQGKQPKKCPELLFEKTLQRIRDRIAARLPEIRADLAGRVDPGLLTPESLCRITTPVFAIDPVVPRVNVSGASSLAADPAVEVKRTWSTTSYSALRRGAPRELPDNSPDPVEEALPAERPAPADPEDIIALRGGTEIGTLLHSVLEKADFEAVPSMDEDRLKERTGQVMRHARGLFGDAYDTALAAVTRMVRDVLTAELPEGIVLATVPRVRRSPELEFDLAVGEVLPGREPLTEKTLIATLRTLCDALKESGRGDPGYTPDYLAPEQIRGFIKGFIDLFFFAQGRYWVIDWKSNWLAGTAGGYTKDAMERAMTQHGYRLQYLLYLVAVMRFLRTRLPEGADVYEQMGGALYIFIRGVRHGAPAGQGVIFDRPHRAVLECLDEVLARGYGKAVVEQFAERIRMEGSHE
jgi:exodeoxyribonuclease V beta subunit